MGRGNRETERRQSKGNKAGICKKGKGIRSGRKGEEIGNGRKVNHIDNRQEESETEKGKSVRER